jgi:hypothetical protein
MRPGGANEAALARRVGKGALFAPCPRGSIHVGTLRFAHPTCHCLSQKVQGTLRALFSPSPACGRAVRGKFGCNANESSKAKLQFAMDAVGLVGKQSRRKCQRAKIEMGYQDRKTQSARVSRGLCCNRKRFPGQPCACGGGSGRGPSRGKPHQFRRLLIPLNTAVRDRRRSLRKLRGPLPSPPPQAGEGARTCPCGTTCLYSSGPPCQRFTTLVSISNRSSRRPTV